jgi:hypothetical protein
LCPWDLEQDRIFNRHLGGISQPKVAGSMRGTKILFFDLDLFLSPVWGIVNPVEDQTKSLENTCWTVLEREEAVGKGMIPTICPNENVTRSNECRTQLERQLTFCVITASAPWVVLIVVSCISKTVWH